MSEVSRTLYRDNKLRIGGIFLFIMCVDVYMSFDVLCSFSGRPFTHTPLNGIVWFIDLYMNHQLLTHWN